MPETLPTPETINAAHIPWDKSWLIRMGALDLFSGYDDTIDFLEQQDSLSDDLVALREGSKAWPEFWPFLESIE